MKSGCLYIPLWFYSNCKARIRASCRSSFTFHYGSIQIDNFLEFVYFVDYFTFHYGSIQMSSPVNTTSPTLFPLHSTMVLFKYKSTVNQRRVCNPLHSTMVLFKFNTHLLTLHFKGFFTFHYGSIQIYSQNFDR